MLPDDLRQSDLAPVVGEQPYPLLFLTISGAHLYGFPSADSDYDLRGAHVLPAVEVVGLHVGPETIEKSGQRNLPARASTDGSVTAVPTEVDLVTHDVRKFFSFLLKRNGYALEQVLSPLVVHTTSAHEELKAICAGCVTRGHSMHYLHMARNQWALAEKRMKIKPVLYTYRALLTGIHLMRTAAIEANLRVLNDHFRLPQIFDLMSRKVNGAEKEPLAETELALHRAEYERLSALLETERAASGLRDTPISRDALHDLLVRVRLETVTGMVDA